MKNWLRGKWGGLATFALMAVLVSGGLAWVTLAALHLERQQVEARALADHADTVRVHERLRQQQLEALRRERAHQAAEAQAEYAARLHLALWRLDSRIAPFLAREDARPYNHYSALYTPAVVLDSTGNRREPPTLLEPSPLLKAELPDWMLLHFQTADSTWGSPQCLPAASQQQLLTNGIGVANVTRRRAQLLAELAHTAVARQLLDCVRAEDRKRAAGRDMQAALTLPPALSPLPPGLANSEISRLAPRKNPAYGYASRAQQKSQNDLETRQQAYFEDNSYAAAQNTSNYGVGTRAVASRQDPGAQVLVSLSPMAPLWLAGPDHPERLLVTRLVRIVPKLPEHLGVLLTLPRPGLPANLVVFALQQRKQESWPPAKEVCQGIVLDWPRLQGLLAEEVKDLFPRARLQPMRQEVPPHPERTMTALPVELDPGPGAGPEPNRDADPVFAREPELAGPVVPVLGWTPLRIGLALSWAAALVGLLAVGLGGWSLLDLSERRIRFVSAVTHELRTPLTTLRLYLDMLTGGLVRDEPRRADYLQTLNTETDRLNRLVGNVLDFSRLENQHPRLERSPVQVGDLLEQLRATWDLRCRDADKELLVVNDAGPKITLVTDVHLFQQILGNLIDNACKYSRGAEDRRIEVRAVPMAGNRLVLEVTDRGPGVSPRERAAIFRPFRRGREADTTAGGVGLGLALAQRWASLLGATLTLESPKEGSGACFRLEVPIKE
jgi:signal transduction histidine kinase